MAGIYHMAVFLSLTFATPLFGELNPSYGGVLIGAFFICFGSLYCAFSIYYVRRGVRTYGIIVGYYRSGEYSSPIVEFTDYSGKVRRARLIWGGGPAIGEPMDIILHPTDLTRDPNDLSRDSDDLPRAVSASFRTLWLFPAIFIVIGVLALIMGTLVVQGVLDSGPSAG